MKKRTSKLLSLLLTLTMVLGMLSMGQVAYAAGITDASNVNVNNHSFYDPGRLYYTNGASDTGNLADNPNWNAHYDPATGVLELKNYNGGEIYAGGLKATDLTIKLTGNNTVTATGQMGVSHIYGGNIIITSDSSGSLTINISSSTTDVNGISAGYGSSYTTGNVTISGNANVTVNATATSTDYGKWANGIYARERVSILDNASYAAVCKSATQSSGAQAGSGIYAQGGGVTLNTSGTVNIDASQAGVSGQGIFSGGGTNQATKVSSMTIKYKKDGSNGVPIYPQYMFDSVADNYAININDTDCVATYRYGTPYTVIVSRGKCDACGKNTGQYLANDTVTITANTLSSGLTFKKWTSSDVAFANANSITTTFTMPSKDVNVSADYNAFTVQPSFTATDTEKGDITFTLTAETTDAPRLVTKDGDESDVVGGQYFYGSGTSRTATIYNGTGTYRVPAGEYRVAARFDGHWFFSDPFEVSYTPSVKTLDSIAITTPPTKTTYTAGESFDTAGMVVTATYNDSSTAEVTSYTVSPSGALATSDTSVTISYTEGGVTKTAAQAITVNAASTPTAPTITTSTLPNGKVGTEYNQSLAATGDTPITWTLDSGNLPDGLTLAADGTISGTPTTAGDYTFTVKATNGAGSDTKSYTVTITSPLGIAIDATNFPDANFRTFVKTYDTDSNGYLSEAELAAVTEMDCHSKEIADLTGIEHFTALTQLDCWDNKLTTLDVNNNTALTELYCYNNQLTSLDVSKNTALTYLDCGTNQLTALDVSANIALTYVRCTDNQLTSLDVSKNTALTMLYCSNNQLTTLDVSKNTQLTTLWCSGNQLTTLDVSANTALTYLWCYNNQLTTLDVSKNTNLKWLHCYGNNLTMLDVSAVPALKDAKENGTKDTSNSDYDNYSSSQGTLRVDKTVNIITDTSSLGIAIDAANFPDANFRTFVKTYDTDSNSYLSEAELAAVTGMDCHSKEIADLTGIEHFTSLTLLYCSSNQLTTLDVSANTALTELRCSNNQLTSLDVSKNTALTELDCYGNKLTTLDVNNNTALTELDCAANKLTSLDVSKNTALTELYCSNNQLTTLDVSNNTALTELYCYNNQLTSLDVSKNTALTYLSCYNNQLTTLDVSNNTALTMLSCSGNQLTSLDVSNNTALTTLYCSGNQLTTLDVSNNTALTELYCYNNQLTSLDVTEVPALKDAKENGTFDDSNSEYDRYSSLQGTLVVDKGFSNIVTEHYTISFAANGGTGTMADVTGISGEYTLPENGFTAPDGKQFKAWSVGGVEKAVGDKITVTADTTVTAVWETIPAGHTCDIKPVAKVEPSCTEGGKEAYYKCEGCGKFYEDALGAKEITDLAAWGNLEKLGHTESGWKSDKDNHWKECTVAGCGVIIENSKAAHKDDNNDGKCDVCEYNVGTTTTKPEDTNKPSDDVQSPQTGDNSMMWLWVALLFVSGFGVVATTVYGKRRTARK